MPVSHVPLAQLIHPTAIVHPGAELHPTVQVGAYSVIGEQVKIGAHTIVGAHVVIDGWTEIGDRNRIFPGAIIGLEPQDLKYDGAISLVKIGNDNQIREYVTINRATSADEMTSIGNSNLLMAYVHVAHNCIIGDHVVITNSVALAGHIVIESRARIGGMVGIHQFVHVGQWAMIGGMSRIERDVPPYMVVEGNPSRVRTIHRIGLERAGLEPETVQLIKQAYRILYRQDFTLPEAIEKLTSLPENSHVLHLQKFLRASLSENQRRGPIPGRN
jgi:UDP-N-acetylglucosamine acyltransferase